MHLVFKDYGSVLGGREFAAELREQIASCPSEVVLDFDNVRTLSHSFADELIAKLAVQYGAIEFKKKIKIINLSESNRAVVAFVISERLSSQVVA